MLARSTLTFALSLAFAFSAAALTASCSDDSESTGSGSGGGTTSTTTTATSATGTGGAGGQGCGDTQTDPANCGECGHPCAPGQTCEAGACVCGADTASFATDVQPILTASCAKALCHSGSMPKDGIDLSTGVAYAELVGPSSTVCTSDMPLVVPGQPSESYMMHKLLGSGMCAGKRMPPAAALPQDQIKTISDWICGGALDN